jgi:hypothetical protein
MFKVLTMSDKVVNEEFSFVFRFLCAYTPVKQEGEST